MLEFFLTEFFLFRSKGCLTIAGLAYVELVGRDKDEEGFSYYIYFSYKLLDVI